jgi:hypothetical protein
VTAVARDLPIPRSVLRLKRELKDEPEDEIRAEPLPEPSDRIVAEDGVEADEEDDWDEEGSRLPWLPGPLIAATTFVPMFLAVFFSLSHLLGGASPTARTANAPVPSAVAPMSDQPPPALSEALRDPFVAPRLVDPDPRDVTRPSDPREALRAPSLGEATPLAVEPAPPPALPTRPTAQPRMATPSAPEPRALRLTETPRQPQAAVLTTTPTAEPRKSGRDWTPAAAFADREAAGRLASSIQQQGYPVEIRQEQSSARPWVVWIGAQPRGGERRR